MLNRNERGFTLIDVLLSVVILIISVSGAIQFRYHAAIQARKARMRTGAAELAQTLAETWRAAGGAESFDSAAHYSPALAITPAAGPAKPADYNLLESYAIQWSEYGYTATLSSKDAGNGLKALNVVVAWPFGNSNTEKEYRITTYADTN